MRTPGLFRALLWCYPAEFRNEYGGEMRMLFAAQLEEARQQGQWRWEALVWLLAIRDVVIVAPQEHKHMVVQDVRYALRTLAGSPVFTAVAILSLALGIGANTAIFSLLNGVLLAPLPVRNPQELVILSDPDAQGMSIGSNTGERGLLTYGEFEAFRNEKEVFAGVMASQSWLPPVMLRVGSGEPEQVRGRFVSGEYFQFLGVSPLIGRTFSRDEENTPVAVIGYDYWQRRFGRGSNVLGKVLHVGKASLTIIGVMPPAFFGETIGQRPDLWVPLPQQPDAVPGRQWLQESGVEKVMWLHVFARLRPGVTVSQAEGKANSVFRSLLETHYGAVQSQEARREFLDQKLRIRPAASGASGPRRGFGTPLRILLGAVGAVLLIACANLANLLLARGAGRQKEIALRLTLGATRGRLIRQLLTESLVLGVAGGLAGLAFAKVFYEGLLVLVGQVTEGFGMHFALDARLLSFSLLLTLTATLLFGLLPALLVTRTEPGDKLKGQGRTATATSGQVRWGRMLVAGQLALSLPLLVGAGLLMRTLLRLQATDLGYEKENVLLFRLDAPAGGYAAQQRAAAYRRLLDAVRPLAGVKGATYSENGLFSGRDSGDDIEVEGYTRTGRNDRGSRWDQVGPGYFSTIGVPLLSGREINEQDTETSTKVCVINAAFAKKFFDGRNPLGLHVTQVYGEQRKTYEVVGVAADLRASNLRREVPHRFYLPVTQPAGEFGDVTLVVRAAANAPALVSTVRHVLRQTDPKIPVTEVRTLEQRLSSQTAQDRVMTQLSIAFGIVGVLLSAIGLYGVLAYGVARRRSEIGIRMALGAQPGRVVGMILRETSLLVGVGLVLGAVLAVAAGRALGGLLFGVPPTDALTFAVAMTILMAVAFAAAYLPARRAAAMNPTVALRQD